MRHLLSRRSAASRSSVSTLDKCNLNGSGISIGHPIGCTGARITYTLANQMKKGGLKRGIASLCIGGGQGMAILLEKV